MHRLVGQFSLEPIPYEYIPQLKIIAVIVVVVGVSVTSKWRRRTKEPGGSARGVTGEQQRQTSEPGDGGSADEQAVTEAEAARKRKSKKQQQTSERGSGESRTAGKERQHTACDGQGEQFF